MKSMTHDLLVQMAYGPKQRRSSRISYIVAQTVLKWYKDAIHTNISRHRSHIVEQEKLGRLFAEYTGMFRQARERYEKELVGPIVKQDEIFQKWHQRRCRCG